MGFFQTVIEYFQRLWDFISNIFSMLGYAITMVVSGISGMQVVLMYMPAVIGGCALVTICVLVLRFLLMK